MARWEKDASVFEETLPRLERIEMIFNEVTQPNPNWDYINELSEKLPHSEEIQKALRQDREVLSKQPNLWEKELQETKRLLAFLKLIFHFLQQKYPSLKTNFDTYIQQKAKHV
ncbi:MAG: hypothetical protein ACE5HG_01990 [Candidatus Bathyarchaeia archaeon]